MTIEQLAERVGIETSYVDFWGNNKAVSGETLATLLNCMGYPCDTEERTAKSLLELEQSQWRETLAPVHIIASELQPDIEVPITLNQLATCVSLDCVIKEESGILHRLSIVANPECIQARFNLAGQERVCYRLTLPLHLPDGYHQLTVTYNGLSANTTLIVAPRCCVTPQDISATVVWGFAVQLYSLRSEHNWGTGDFGDLKTLVCEAARRGAGVIGLNPLHALYPSNPNHCSPYSPTSRSFLNTLYIDIEAVVALMPCEKAIIKIAQSDFQQMLASLRASEKVDYVLVATCKARVLELLFAYFCEHHLDRDTDLGKAFMLFCQERGKSLEQLAVFDALHEHFNTLGNTGFQWQSWPEQYQSPKSVAVQTFKRTHAKRITLFKYLQWLADRQLGEVACEAKSAGMPLGLYMDLAVGCDNASAEVWSNLDLFVPGVSVGAPPDPLSLTGQNWGLSAINPLVLRAQAYAPFIKTLCANMRHAGALRIDHVIGLMRQYWVLPGQAADAGVFVRFPFDELLRIVALESHRHRCLIIGEDLGTVPDGLRERLSEAALQSYRILFFERWSDGLFKRPDSYPEQSMVTISTHDLPTLAGWWSGDDIKLRRMLDLYPDEQREHDDINNRARDRELLIAALVDAGVLSSDVSASQLPSVVSTAILVAVQSFLARSPSRLHLIPLEDALGLQEQVNLPGTIDQYPNWRHRLPISLELLFNHHVIKSVLQAVQDETVNRDTDSSDITVGTSLIVLDNY